MRYKILLASRISKYKAISVCYYRYCHKLLTISLERWRGDHKGFVLEIYLLGFGVGISLYDTRHEDAY